MACGWERPEAGRPGQPQKGRPCGRPYPGPLGPRRPLLPRPSLQPPEGWGQAWARPWEGAKRPQSAQKPGPKGPRRSAAKKR